MAWSLRRADDRLALAHTQRLGVHEVIGRILAGREVPLDQGARYLNPTLKTDMPDPDVLAGMEAAAERLAHAIVTGETIGLFGDYDVDGATSTALLTRFLRAAGIEPTCYIPDRLTEGYGPSIEAFGALADAACTLIVTLDCGTVATAPLASARQRGVDVIVVDHHQAPGEPIATAVLVNPKQAACGSGLDYLAAVGVTFFLVVATNRRLKSMDFFTPSRPAPDLMGFLDLVALGTVCDVVPLIGVNRALALRGFEQMARRTNIGLAALADVSGVKERPGAYHAGFLLGPRINAGGRLGDPALGLRLLATEDPVEAKRIAGMLDDLNRERQAIEARVLEEAVVMAEEHLARNCPSVLVLGSAGWHPGVLGIVASRLKERFGLPTFIFGFGEEGMATGSARSLSGVDMGGAVHAAVEAGLAVKGGGHAMAAGATVEAARFAAFGAFLDERLAETVARAKADRKLALDGAIALEGATPELADVIAQAGPYGAGNPEPLFALPAVRIVRRDWVGQHHARLILADLAGQRLKGMAFRCRQTALGAALDAWEGRPVHVAGRIRLDSWRKSRAVTLQVEDVALAG